MKPSNLPIIFQSIGFVGMLASINLWATPEGLVHHWNFDEGPDWHDSPFQAVHAGTHANDSHGALHATLQNMAPANWVSGRQYAGLEFDGTNQYISVTSSLATTLGGSASFSFWIRTTQSGTATPGTAPGIAGQAGAGGIQWGWLDDSGRIGLGLDGLSVLRSVEPINDGAWHHVVITRNATSGQVKIYVDGNLSNSLAGASGVRANAFFSLGRIEGAGHFAGRLDQITIFDRAIPPEEVTSQYTNHAPKSWNIISDGVNDRPFTTPSVFFRAFDVERDSLAVKSWTSPTHGVIVHNGDGSFTYTASPGFVGEDTFEVTITDSKGGYRRSTMSLEIISEPVGGRKLPVKDFTDFAPVQAGGADLRHSGMRVPRAINWNGDGLNDLLVGAGGYVWRYLNTGTAVAPTFDAGVKVQANGVDIYAGTNSNSPITLADMTGDGVADLIMADHSSKLRLYRNTAAAGATPVYAAHTFIKQSDGVADLVLPDKRFDIGDYNADGSPDLIVGTGSGNVRLFLNVNTAAMPRFQDSTVLFSESYNIYPRFCDLGSNGQTDLVRGINWGDVKFWLDVPKKGLEGSQYLAIKDAHGATPALKDLTDGVIADFADFNGDGKNDMLLGGHNGGADKKVFIAYGVSKTAADSIAEIESIYDANLADLGNALSANFNQLLNQVNAANLNLVHHLRVGSLGTREAVFTALAAHIDKYDFLKYQELDTAVYHHVPSIVLQNWVILGNLLPDTPARRVTIADVMGLTGLARTIYLENGLAIGDNAKSNGAAYGSIRDFMRRHPREAFPDSILTFNQLYGDERGGFVWTPNSTKNTFGQGALGNANEWAADLTTAIEGVLGAGSASGDYFTFVMGHEVIHSLDNYVNTRANQDLRRRLGARMVYAAGPHVRAGANGWFSRQATEANFQALGYYDPATQTWSEAWDAYWSTGPGAAFNSLASMRINIQFFLGAPQEALATQANHHWANGPGRLIGALDRFRRAEQQGIEPIKANMTEVVDFIDFISSGMNRVNLVETKNQGGVVVWFDHFAHLVRDDEGRITRITVDGRSYQLTLDADGLVTRVLTDADLAPRTVGFSDATSFRNETDGVIMIDVTLDRPARYAPISVDFSDATTGTAVAGLDYTLNPGTLTFNDGEQTQSVTVTLLNDAVMESPESLVLTLSNPSGASIGNNANHVVNISDAFSPSIPTQQFTATSTMNVATVIGTVTGTPVADRTMVDWSIVAGNTGDSFGINESGQLTLLHPANLGLLPATRQIVVRGVDSAGAASDGTMNIICNPPAFSGVWERRWSGSNPYNNQIWTGPTNYSGTLDTFTTIQDVANNYSRRLIGYLQPQVSGDYTFWIAADDSSRLYLSTNSTEESKVEIARTSSWTPFQNWGSNPSQQSAVIPLMAGQVYWMEVHQLEASGGDHASVAWSGPGFGRQTIPATAIFPAFGLAATPASVALTSPADGSSTNLGQALTLHANAVAGSSAITSVDFYDGNVFLATDTDAPYSYVWTNAQTGSHSLSARVVSADGSVTSPSVAVNVIPVPLEGYAQWLELYFGDDSANPLVAGETADPNHDGLANLLAYAMGINPLLPPDASVSPAERGRIELIWESGAFHFNYQRNTLASDVTLILEQTNDLADPDSWKPAEVAEQILAEKNGIRTIRAIFTPHLWNTRSFFRLRARR